MFGISNLNSMPSLRQLLKVSSADMECLFPRRLINGETINAYLRIVERRSFFYQDALSVFAFDTYFLECWNRGKYPLTKRRTEGISTFDFDILLFPLHLPNKGTKRGHWSLIVVKPKKQVISVYDSLRKYWPEEIDKILDFLEEEAQAKKEHKFDRTLWLNHKTSQKCPRQTNSVDCGVFICIYAEILCRKGTLNNRKICSLIARKKIAQAIRRARIGNEDFPLLEYPLWDRYCQSHAPSSAVTIVVYTSPGMKETVEVQDDPLIHIMLAKKDVKQKRALGNDLNQQQITTEAPIEDLQVEAFHSS